MSINMDFNNMTVVKLKEYMRQHNIRPLTGRKADLISRIYIYKNNIKTSPVLIQKEETTTQMTPTTNRFDNQRLKIIGLLEKIAVDPAKYQSDLPIIADVVNKLEKIATTSSQRKTIKRFRLILKKLLVVIPLEEAIPSMELISKKIKIQRPLPETITDIPIIPSVIEPTPETIFPDMYPMPTLKDSTKVIRAYMKTHKIIGVGKKSSMLTNIQNQLDSRFRQYLKVNNKKLFTIEQRKENEKTKEQFRLIQLELVKAQKIYNTAYIRITRAHDIMAKIARVSVSEAVKLIPFTIEQAWMMFGACEEILIAQKQMKKILVSLMGVSSRKNIPKIDKHIDFIKAKMKTLQILLDRPHP